jgi:hypothetical protein
MRRRSGYRLGPAALVVEPGEHDDRRRVAVRAQVAQRLQALGVREREVEQHAVDPVRRDPRRVGERLDALERERGARDRQQILHQQGVGVVVLDQEDLERLGQ